MLCLFKNSSLSPFFHFLAQVMSLSLVSYWLYFAFIDKNFISDMFAGRALMVDLLLGLPVVIVFAVVIYAFSYWMIKLFVIVFFPNTIIPLVEEADSEEDFNTEFGEEYWNKLPDDSVVETTELTILSDKKTNQKL